MHTYMRACVCVCACVGACVHVCILQQFMYMYHVCVYLEVFSMSDRTKFPIVVM